MRFVLKFAVVASMLAPLSFVRAKSFADIYLFAGQSNMWGTGNKPEDLPPELAAIDENVRVLTLKGDPQPGASVPLQNGVNNNWAPGAWGSEAQLMHRLSAIATDKPIYMLKVSAGGTWLAERPPTEQTDWNPRSQGELLDAFTGDIAKARRSLESAGKTPRFKAFVWMQGEADSNELAAAQAYQADMEALIQRVRDAATTPDMPVYLGRVQVQYSGPELQTLRASQARVAAAGRNVYLIDTDPFALHPDKIHYAPAGQIAFGNAIFDMMTGVTKPAPAIVTPEQSFTLRAFAGPGTHVGQVALSSGGVPPPTFVIDHPGFEIDGVTGVMRVKNLDGIDFATTSELKMNVWALNGAAPSGVSEVTIRIDRASDPAQPVAGRYMVLDPDAAADVVITQGAYTELRDAIDPARKYTAERPPEQGTFPGTTKKSLGFDGRQMMIGPRSSDFLTPGVDEDVTIAMAIHIAPAPEAKKSWCAVINKADTQPAIGIGYDYGESKFYLAYANSFNGAVQQLSTTERFELGATYIVRLRKAGNTVRLYIDGNLAAEAGGKGVRRPILAENEGASIGLGGMFRPAPSFVGSIGKIYIVKGIPTTREEAYIDSDLIQWANPTPKTN